MSHLASEPLSRAIVPAKQAAKRHYGSHPYFTKRAWNVVQEYIRHFSSPGDTVLDPYGGSGVTATESLVLRRKAVYADINEWACFLARQTAVAPVNLDRLREGFAEVEAGCRSCLEDLWSASNQDLEKRPLADWYPKGIALPGNADVELVEQLFTVRMLHGLARLRACIMAVRDKPSRDLLRFAFSATLARINRTFLSATNRSESRGGSAIFSLYRYKVAKQPIELPLWDQFARRFGRLLQAKLETNQLIGDFYKENDTAIFRHGSATQLLDWMKPGSVDYIYTDPPYGGHIAYLDLSTMWAAWLGFGISPEDRASEVIEGGELSKSREDYQQLLSASLQQMHEVLKSGCWLSIVFAHRDTSYWEGLVNACCSAGFEYVNTVTQPVGVVWSVHKKKNPLRVLSGELVLNFRKSPRPHRARPLSQGGNALAIVQECCEQEIVRGSGASTEDLHHAVVPRLLEAGLLGDFSRDHGDLTAILKQHFEFERATSRWHIPEGVSPAAQHAKEDLTRYYITRLLSRRRRNGLPTTEAVVQRHIQARLNNGRAMSKSKVLEILKEVGYSPNNRHWCLRGEETQQEFFFGAEE